MKYGAGVTPGVGERYTVQHTGFSDEYSTIPKDNEEEKIQRYGDPNVSGVFTAPQLAFNHSTGGREDGAFNGRFENLG